MSIFNKTFTSSNETAAEIDSRLRSRPSRWEFFALAFAFCSAGIFLWTHKQLQFKPLDYNVYIKTVNGDLLQFYYADWILPVFWLWAKLSYWWGYALWAAVNILCIFFAARVFGGTAALTLLTFQMFYALYYGQIIGVLIGGLALGWWGMTHRHWYLAGLGFFIASTKFQIGIPFGLLLWITANASWRERLRVLLLPFILTILSLAIRPNWPLDLLRRIQDYPPNDSGSISLWQWIGPAALMLYVLPLLISLGREKRFLALAAASPLALPYFQSSDLLMLYVLPVGWLPVLMGNLGFLFFKYQFQALRWLWVVPMTLYLVILISDKIERQS
ncbi:MAG: glycosyltransferase family 87 protein [Anaerolineae bacterium]|nr:glycosyltransferase family 87 protein [Anaerolineae bacterium]